MVYVELSRSFLCFNQPVQVAALRGRSTLDCTRILIMRQHKGSRKISYGSIGPTGALDLSPTGLSQGAIHEVWLSELHLLTLADSLLPSNTPGEVDELR